MPNVVIWILHSFNIKMKLVLAVLALALAVSSAQDISECPVVNPIRNFKYPAFEGQWFEIGHYRNDGPSIWADECFCSTSNVTQDPLGLAEGDSVYSYACNLEDPEGFLQALDTTLFIMGPPGQWFQEVIPNPTFEWHTFTVVDMTDDYALVYRCGHYDLDLSYTAQILSRKPSLDQATVEKLKAKVTEFKLNPLNSPYVEVPHGNCTYTDH